MCPSIWGTQGPLRRMPTQLARNEANGLAVVSARGSRQRYAEFPKGSLHRHQPTQLQLPVFLRQFLNPGAQVVQLVQQGHLAFKAMV